VLTKRLAILCLRSVLALVLALQFSPAAISLADCGSPQEGMTGSTWCDFGYQIYIFCGCAPGSGGCNPSNEDPCDNWYQSCSAMPPCPD
jgi:hypothetical protein